jgi:hypothetical protein
MFAAELKVIDGRFLGSINKKLLIKINEMDENGA